MALTVAQAYVTWNAVAVGQDKADVGSELDQIPLAGIRVKLVPNPRKVEVAASGSEPARTVTLRELDLVTDSEGKLINPEDPESDIAIVASDAFYGVTVEWTSTISALDTGVSNIVKRWSASTGTTVDLSTVASVPPAPSALADYLAAVVDARAARDSAIAEANRAESARVGAESAQASAAASAASIGSGKSYWGPYSPNDLSAFSSDGSETALSALAWVQSAGQGAVYNSTTGPGDEWWWRKIGASWVAGSDGVGGASSWDELTGKPTNFPPSSHSHSISDVVGLQSALAPISQMSSMVVVTVGTESRPDASLVMWLDMREGASQLEDPISMGSYDIRLIPTEDVVGDTTPPTTPSGVTISATTQSSLTVMWNASTDDVGVTGYEVRIDSNPAIGIPPSPRTYVFSGLSAGSQHDVQVRARDLAGNRSTWSEPIHVSTDQATPVGTPPTITTTSLEPMTVGTPVSQTIAYTGDTVTTVDVSSGTLPTAVTVSVTGGVVTVSGTPTAAASGSATIRVTNPTGSDTQTYSWSVVVANPTSGNIFGAARPFSESSSVVSVQQDAAGIWSGNRFYTTATNGIRVTGVRVWNPAGATSPFLTSNVDVAVWAQDFQGTDPGFPNWASPTQAATSTGTRSAGTWTEVALSTPVVIVPRNATVGASDFLVAAVRFGTSGFFVRIDNDGGVSYDYAGTVPNVFVVGVDSGIARGIHSGPGNYAGGYGVDILFEVI